MLCFCSNIPNFTYTHEIFRKKNLNSSYVTQFFMFKMVVPRKKWFPQNKTIEKNSHNPQQNPNIPHSLSQNRKGMIIHKSTAINYFYMKSSIWMWTWKCECVRWAKGISKLIHCERRIQRWKWKRLKILKFLRFKIFLRIFTILKSLFKPILHLCPHNQPLTPLEIHHLFNRHHS